MFDGLVRKQEIAQPLGVPFFLGQGLQPKGLDGCEYKVETLKQPPVLYALWRVWLPLMLGLPLEAPPMPVRPVPILRMMARALYSKGEGMNNRSFWGLIRETGGCPRRTADMYNKCLPALHVESTFRV